MRTYVSRAGWVGPKQDSSSEQRARRGGVPFVRPTARQMLLDNRRKSPRNSGDSHLAVMVPLAALRGTLRDASPPRTERETQYSAFGAINIP